MDEKELKKALNELGETMDAKLEKYSKELSAINEEKARKAALQEIKGVLEPELKKINEMQAQLDAIDTKLKRTDSTADLRKSFAEQLKEKIAGRKGEQLKGQTFNFELKVDEMTQGNSFESTVVVPYDQKPGIVFDPDRTTHARNIIAVGNTSSNVVSYVQEYAETLSTYTGLTAEGASYKQGDVDLKMLSATVQKITAYLVISEEMLEDVDGLQSYLLTRMPAKIRNYEDAFVLRDTTYGLVGKATTYVDEFEDADIDRFQIIVAALKQVKVSEYQPNFILMHPTDVMQLKLTKDDNGNYIFPWIFVGPNVVIDGVPVFESTMMNSGTFLVGDGRLGAMIFDRRQLSIEFSNSNSDNFIKGMVTVRGSERIAFVVYRTKAFVYGTFATALAAGSA